MGLWHVAEGSWELPAASRRAQPILRPRAAQQHEQQEQGEEAAAAEEAALSLDGSAGAQPMPSSGGSDGEQGEEAGAAFDGVLSLTPQHYQYICGLRWAGGAGRGAALFTASYDGSLRRLDPERGVSGELAGGGRDGCWWRGGVATPWRVASTPRGAPPPLPHPRPAAACPCFCAPCRAGGVVRGRRVQRHGRVRRRPVSGEMLPVGPPAVLLGARCGPPLWALGPPPQHLTAWQLTRGCPCPAVRSTVLLGDNEGGLQLVDVRAPQAGGGGLLGSARSGRHVIHAKKLNTVHFEPTQEQVRAACALACPKLRRLHHPAPAKQPATA